MRYEQIPVAEFFASGEGKSIAALRLEVAELEKRLGITFTEEFDDLDEFWGAALRLPSGDQFLLKQYKHSVRPGIDLDADAGVHTLIGLHEFLRATSLSAGDVVWQAPE